MLIDLTKAEAEIVEEALRYYIEDDFSVLMTATKKRHTRAVLRQVQDAPPAVFKAKPAERAIWFGKVARTAEQLAALVRKETT